MGTFRSITAGMAAVTLSAAVASGFPRETTDSRESVQRFHGAIDAYVELRETVTKGLPPLEISPNPENFLRAVDAIAAALREARPSAAEGDLINAGAAAVFRQRIRATLGDRGCTVADIARSSQVSDRAVPTIPRLTGNGGAL